MTLGRIGDGDGATDAAVVGSAAGAVVQPGQDHVDDDPLFFIETMPSRETRLFIERVMANYWIYQNRLGQSTATLDAVASGASPIYDRQDEKVTTASN